MSLTDTTDPTQTAALTFELDLQHPPETVWRALTSPTVLAQWLLPVVEREMKLERGAGFTLQAQPHPGWGGTVNCKVLESIRLERLSYTWVVGEFLDTVVTFTLTANGAGTKVSMVQSGFKPEQKQNFGGARYGWKLMGSKLVELLEAAS